jgi:transcriptional regulator GlxA family with amidase domain
VLELRRRWQRTWAQIATECGFADQAHLIRDFHAHTRLAPETLFRMTASEAVQPINAILSRSAFCNSFVV